jgi:hypothetical protein
MNDATQHRPSQPGDAMKEGLSSFAADVRLLIDLQTELLRSEFGQWRKRTSAATTATVVGGIVALPALGATLAGLGLWLSEAAGWPPYGGLMTVGGGALIAAAISILLGVRRLQQESPIAPRWQAELNHNITWVLESLARVSPGKTAGNQIPPRS